MTRLFDPQKARQVEKTFYVRRVNEDKNDGEVISPPPRYPSSRHSSISPPPAHHISFPSIKGFASKEGGWTGQKISEAFLLHSTPFFPFLSTLKTNIPWLIFCLLAILSRLTMKKKKGRQTPLLLPHTHTFAHADTSQNSLESFLFPLSHTHTHAHTNIKKGVSRLFFAVFDCLISHPLLSV